MRDLNRLLRLRTLGMLCLAPLLLGASSGCGKSAAQPAPDMSTDMTYISTDPLIVARPYEFDAPDDYDATKAYPLVIALHGYRATGFFVDRLFRMSDSVDAKQFVYAFPQGTPDSIGYSHWNDSGAANDTDDIAYLDAVIKDMSTRYHVDPNRVLVMGHSNGAAMAYFYACTRSSTVAAIVPVAGIHTTDPTMCMISHPISQIQIIGDMDPDYMDMPPFRVDSVFWATLDGCSATSNTSLPKIHMNGDEPMGVAANALDTSVEVWPSCMGGSDVEYWVVGGAPHNIQFDNDFAPTIIDWLNAHPKS